MSRATEDRIAVKALIAQGIDQAIKRLEEILDPASPAYNTFVLLKSRYKQYMNNVMLGMTGQDELNKQHTQISHAFIVAVDALEDSDLKPLPAQPPPLATPKPDIEIPIHRPEEEKSRPHKEVPAAAAKANTSSISVPVYASESSKSDSSTPVAVPGLLTNRKYQVIGAVALTIAAVSIWAMLSGKEKPAALPMAEKQAGVMELKQPDTASMAVSIQPQTNTTPQKAAGDTPKNASEPVKKPSEPITATKNLGAATASIGANDLSFDGKTYRIFRSGGRIWMAQNLDYQLPGSWCYGSSDANCLKYGRLYTLSAAKKACAAMGAGWHLPSAKEWKSLVTAYGGAGEDATDGGAAAFKALTAGGARSFSAQLGGWRNAEGRFKHLGTAGYYWSSTENDLGLIQLYLFSNGELSQVNNDPKLGFSCRCVK